MTTKPSYEELEKRNRELEQAAKKYGGSREDQHRSAIFIRAVMDNLPIGVAVNSVDPAVNFTYMNENFPRIYRTTREALAGADSFWEAVYEDPVYREKIKRRVLEDCASKDTERMYWQEVPITRLGQKTTYVSAKNVPIPDQKLMLSTVWDVTDYRRAVEALQDSEKKYRRIFENSVVGFFQSTPQGRFISVNPAFAAMLGYDSPEDLMASISDIATQYYFDPDDRRRYRQILQRDGKVDGFEFRIWRKDRTTMWVSNSTRAYFDDTGDVLHYEGVVSDITERKKAEQSLRESEQRFRELFDNMSAGVAIYASPDGGESFIFKDFNAAGLANTKKKKNEVIGREVREVFPGIEAIGLLDVFRKVWRTGESEHHPSSVYKDDDLELWVENYICKLPSGELVAIYEDTTARRKAEQAKQKLERLVQQTQRLESIGNLAGGVAHDFNNILFPIVGMAELLLEDLPAGSIEHENAFEILKAGKRGRDLVRQILAFSRQSEQEMMPVRVQQVLKEVIRLVRSTIPADIEISHDIQADCGLVMADPTQLHQVAMNLVTNAYHAVEPTGGKITVRLKEKVLSRDDPAIKSTSLRPGRYARLSVADTGCGIDPRVKDKIFEPYYTTKAPGKGTGLGLSVVYGIIKELGGDIRVASEVGKGATFEVFFPLIQKTERTSLPETAENLAGGSESVLLVDDDDSVARLERQMLERLGYQVASRLSSLDALDAFKADPGKYDLVITDMNMPNMTGDQLASALIAVRPDIPVIICTGFSERIDKERAAAAGNAGFLMKPIVKSELAQMVRRMLDQARDKRYGPCNDKTGYP